MCELATAMVMDRSTLGHNLRPLERDNLVILKLSADDRRKRHVELTKKGRDVLHRSRRLWERAEGRFEEIFGKQPAAELRAVLLKIAGNKELNFTPDRCTAILSEQTMWIVRVALQRPYTFIMLAVLIVLMGGYAIVNTATDIFPEYQDSDRRRDLALQRHPAGGNRQPHRPVLRAHRADHRQRRRAHRIAVGERHGGGQIFLPARRRSGPVVRRRSPRVSQVQLRVLAAGHHAAVRAVLQRLERADSAAGAVERHAARRRRSTTSATRFCAPSWRPWRAPPSPIPFGGKQRQVQVDLDPQALRANGLSANDVVAAIGAQNLILPAGTAENRPARVLHQAQCQPDADRGPEQPADPRAQRHGHLRPRCRPRARRLLAADQHGAPGRPPRRADERAEDRQSLDHRHHQQHQREAAADPRLAAAGTEDRGH